MLFNKFTLEEIYRKFGEYLLAEYIEKAFPIKYWGDSEEKKKILRKRLNYMVFRTADNTYVRGN